jgi:hypothetical protein
MANLAEGDTAIGIDVPGCLLARVVVVDRSTVQADEYP